MNGDAEPAVILDEMRGLYGAERSEDCIALADLAWSVHGATADAHLGECWRFAMIAASKVARPDIAVVWRARARSAFARTNCQNGMALTMLPDFFAALEMHRDTPTVALSVLDAIAATIGGADDPIEGRLALGIVAEKRGFLRSEVGAASGESEMLLQARDDYDQALSMTTDVRRGLKVRAGRTSVDYLVASNDGEREDAVASLEAVLAEAGAAGTAAAEVLRVGAINL